MVCDAVPSFSIGDFPNGKVFKDEKIVAVSAGELNAQGFGRERTNNWNGKVYAWKFFTSGSDSRETFYYYYKVIVYFKHYFDGKNTLEMNYLKVSISQKLQSFAQLKMYCGLKLKVRESIRVFVTELEF